ncbi:MAG: hypothetical protein JXA71_07345 [Chitinispirillaceae bacterium]|nr:hypothetical protein [Chitinispirillaceae bacterium]
MNNRATISRLLLERYVLKELPPDRMQQVRDAVERDPALQKQVQEITESNEAILKQYPPAEMAREIESKRRAQQVRTGAAERKERFSLFWVKGAFAAALLAVMAISIPLLLHNQQLKNSAPGDVRIKGLQPHLTVFRKVDLPPGVEEMKNYSLVRTGDVLQIGYVSAGEKYGVIVSLDGSGSVTLHYPAAVSGSSRLTGDGKELLEKAYELDSAPRFERFFFVTSNDSIAVPRVLDAVKKLGRQPAAESESGTLDLPRTYTQYSMVLKKEHV